MDLGAVAGVWGLFFETLLYRVRRSYDTLPGCNEQSGNYLTQPG